MTETFGRLLPAIVIGLLPAGTPLEADMTYTLSLQPVSGSIDGPPGAPIGWGYSITNNDSTDWLVTTNLTSIPIADASPDSSLFDFPIISPGSTVSLPYDPTLKTGIFGLTWNADAPVGFTNAGVFTLDAQWWTNNPFSGGMFLRNAPEQTVSYSATVSSNVPEPASSVLLLLALTVIAPIIRRARRATRVSS